MKEGVGMFLNRLHTEEKKAFLELAHYVARSDGDFSDKEKVVIDTYCFEMQIDDIDFAEDNFEIENTLQKIKNKKSQKIVLLEIMALVLSDDIVHKNEQKIIDKITNFFGFDKSLSNLFIEWTKTILSVSNQGKILIEL
jgi:tellurite resistance protein